MRGVVVGDSEVSARIAIRSQILSCAKCSARASCDSPVPFTGSNPANLVVIGDVPGGVEGDVMRRGLDAAFGGRVGDEGVSDYCTYLNVVSCDPGRTPTRLMVDSCRNNLWGQLEVLRPRYGVLCGGVAITALVPGVSSAREVRGKWVRIQGSGWTCMLMCTWHPREVKGMGVKREEWEGDLEKFAEGATRHGLVPELVGRSWPGVQGALL